VCSVLEWGGMEWNHSIPPEWNRSILVFGLDKKLSWNRSILVFGFGMGVRMEWNGSAPGGRSCVRLRSGMEWDGS
jgi:hypothetical protein